MIDVCGPYAKGGFNPGDSLLGKTPGYNPEFDLLDKTPGFVRDYSLMPPAQADLIVMSARGTGHSTDLGENNANRFQNNPDRAEQSRISIYNANVNGP